MPPPRRPRPPLPLLLSLLFCALASAATLPDDVLPFVPPAAPLDALPVADKLFGSLESDVPVIPFSPLVQTLVLGGDGADVLFSFSLLPESGFNVSDYSVRVSCSNHDTIHEADVELGPPVLMEGGRANYSASITIERSVGEADVTFSFLRRDRTVYTTIAVHYIICGISFFHFDKKTATKTLIPANHLNIPSYQSLVSDDLIVCYVFIQYPDGSSSTSIVSDKNNLPPLSDIKTAISGKQLVSTHSFDTCVTGHASFKNDTVVLKDSCSFGFTELGVGKHPYFGVQLLKYRTGTITFRFQWDGFLAGTIFEEVFETHLSITVGGSPPPAVIAITPPGPFQMAGGQRIDCVVINALPSDKFLFVLGNKTLASASVKTSDIGWTMLSYITVPGWGKGIPWSLNVARGQVAKHLTCPWAGQDDRFVFDYTSSDIFIKSVSPSFGPVRGGTSVTFEGFFGDIDLSAASGDAIFLGAYAVERKYIISVTPTTIVFALPPLQVAQTPSFEVECSVVVHGVRSNEVTFVYESLHTVTIEVTGGSYNEKNDTHLVPVCPPTSSPGDLAIVMYANVNSGAPLAKLKIRWRVVVHSTREEVVTYEGSLEAQSFSILRSKLKGDETYEVIVLVSDVRYNTEISSTIRLQPTFSKMLGVGLTMDHFRTIAFPPVDARITVVVLEPATCFGNIRRLSYEWTFLSETKVTSPETEEIDFRSPSPRRLGREFMIPRGSLSYGKHEVRVKVFNTDQPTMYGVATAFLTVQPAVLQAVIGSGESLILSSTASDLEITGARSYDPDTGSAADLSYEWRCEFSTEGKALFTSVAPCPPDFLPESSIRKEKIKVKSAVLRSVAVSNQTATYVRYSLYVRKSYKGLGIRSSPLASQVVEIVAEDKKLTQLGRIAVTSTDGRALRRDDVAYYAPFVLAPEAATGTSWRFRLIEPASESFTFLKNPGNLIHLPGYFSPGDMTAGRRMLGLREGALMPGTEYKFEVEYESRSGDLSSRVEVTIHTIAKPKVRFLPLTLTEGGPETLFSAVAVPSSESYAFKYYFYIKLVNGTEICIDGCSGQRNVVFRIPMVGRHSIRCVMVDSKGKYVLDTADEVQTIDISESAGKDSVRAVSEAPDRSVSFGLGDHSTFEIESVYLAAYAKGVNVKDETKSAQVSEQVSTALRRLSGMYRKTQPNTPLGRDYLLIVHAFASLPIGTEAISLGTFYDLCQMLFYAIHNTPVSDRFDMRDSLVGSFKLLAAHAKQMYAAGSARSRLVGEEKQDVNEAFLELSELIVPMMARVMTRAVPCGFVGQEKLSELATVSVAAYCNFEQGSRIDGRYSSMGWCSDVFEDDGLKKQVFVLGEFQEDYISESGVLRLRKSSGKVNVGDEKSIEIDTDNMASHGYVITKTMVVEADMLDNSGVRFGDVIPADIVSGNRTCFTVRQSVRSVQDIFANRAEVLCRSASSVEYVNVKSFNKTLPKNAYREQTVKSELLSNSSGDDTNTASAIVLSALPTVNGKTFGVKRGLCRDLRPLFIGVIVGVWLPIALVLGTVLLTIVLWLGGTRYVVAASQPIYVESDAPYIERDVYGRDLNFGEGPQLAVDGELDDEVDGAGGDGGMAEEDDGDEEVVFTGTPRKRDAGGTPRVAVRRAIDS